jgi:hypothetical protein
VLYLRSVREPAIAVLHRRLPADSHLNFQVVGKLNYPISNWDNSIFDSAIILDLLTGTADSPYRQALVEYVTLYVKADGTDSITCVLSTFLF